MNELQIERLSGKALENYIPELARLRIEVFRGFPYLYDGDYAYEEKYLKTYINSSDSVIVLAFDGDKIVGASTAIPLEHETDEVKRPFIEHGYDPKKVFYCGESVLQKQYRGRGLGVRFFAEREAHARELGRFDYSAFCCVERPENHPRRPQDYIPLDEFWKRRGYTKHPELTTTYTWKDLDEQQPSPKLMVFWLKSLKETAA